MISVAILVACIGACIATSVPIVGQQSCDTFEEYKYCGTPEPSCDNSKPAAVRGCASRQVCQCLPGYWRNQQGHCVTPSECPQVQPPAPICGQNQEYKYCKTWEATCENQVLPVGQPQPPCQNGCQCLPGYYKNVDGFCVTQQECPALPPVCPLNEQYFECGHIEPTCAIQKPDQLPGCQPSACMCLQGYYRNAQGLCVPQQHCPLVIPTCGQFEEYKYCGLSVEPTCDLQQPKQTGGCRRSVCQCLPGYYRNIDGLCVSQPECPRVEPECPLYEEYKQCGTFCEPVCGKPKPASCIEGCKLNVCQCREGFARSYNKQCVPHNPITGAC